MAQLDAGPDNQRLLFQLIKRRRITPRGAESLQGTRTTGPREKETESSLVPIPRLRGGRFFELKGTFSAFLAFIDFQQRYCNVMSPSADRADRNL